MGKKSVVVEVIKEKLSPYGFEYVGYECLRWTFSRKVNDVAQWVVIPKSYYSNDYTLEISTEVEATPLRIPEFIQDPKYRQYEFINYKNPEEQRRVLEFIGDIVIKYGLDVLNENSKGEKPKYYEATPEMYRKLQEEKEILTQKFMRRYGLDSLTPDKVLPYIKKELAETFDKEYEEVQVKLVELGAVYGNMIIDEIGWRWKTDQMGWTGVDKVPSYVIWDVNQRFSNYYLKKDADLPRKDYQDLRDSCDDRIMRLKKAYGEKWKEEIDQKHNPLPKYALTEEEIEKFEKYLKRYRK